MTALAALERILGGFPNVLIGYSGGVDSTLLAVVARRVLGRDRAVCAIGVSPSLARAQYDQAMAVARTFDLDVVEVATHEMADPEYAANDVSRCFHCKRELWSRLETLARARQIAVVADGTIADDLREHRPGMAAGREAGVRSPLAEAGYGKDQVRADARALGIAIWDAPAAPCLASRVRYGITVTPERLHQVEEGEALLRALGVAGDLRVRHRGEEARIEVAAAEFDRVREARVHVAQTLFALGFSRVTLDLGGYRRGSLLERGSAEVELLASR